MRKTLIKQLIRQDDKDTYFLTADVGYNALEPLQKKMGKRFINVGIAEQSMISIASGLALAGKKVYTYTMCAFYLRAVEQIRNDVCYQDVPVTMIGVGTGYDYGFLGTTHFAHEDGDILGSLSNILVSTPKDEEAVRDIVKRSKLIKTPLYIRIGYDHKKRFKEKYPKIGGVKDYFLNRRNANRQHVAFKSQGK